MKTFFIIFGILIISTLIVLGIPCLVALIAGHFLGDVGASVGIFVSSLGMLAFAISLFVRK